MSAQFEWRPPKTVWTAEDNTLLRRLVRAGVSVADGSDLLDCGMGEYRLQIELLGLRPKPMRGRRPCLMCERQFTSDDIWRFRCCDECKKTDRWRFARDFGVAHVRGETRGRP